MSKVILTGTRTDQRRQLAAARQKEHHVPDPTTPAGEQPVAIVRDADGVEQKRIPVKPIPARFDPAEGYLQAGWEAVEPVGFDVADGWTIQFPPFPDSPAAPVLDPAGVRAIVREELASMGGDMLQGYGDNADPKARTIAAIGGYVLERFGGGGPDSTDAGIVLESGDETE